MCKQLLWSMNHCDQSSLTVVKFLLIHFENNCNNNSLSQCLLSNKACSTIIVLNKQEFRLSAFRYNVPLSDLPSKCVCGEKYTVSRALSCKKGGFAAQRHDSVRNLLTSFLGKICINVEVEPQLQPLDNERLNLIGAVTVQRQD